MSDEKKNNKKSNPFDILTTVSTRHIEVKALRGAKVEIKNSLTVDEENHIKSIAFENQTVTNGSVVPNQSDLQLSKRRAVSYLLVEPKMTMSELGKLNGGMGAIDEIYKSYVEYQQETEGN